MLHLIYLEPEDLESESCMRRNYGLFYFFQRAESKQNKASVTKKDNTKSQFHESNTF